MRRTRRPGYPALVLLLVAVVGWAVTPRALNDDERRLVGRWTDPEGGGVIEYRADRTARPIGGPDEADRARWRLHGDRLRLTVDGPPPANPAAWVRSLLAGPPQAIVFRLRWEGPDTFRLTELEGMCFTLPPDAPDSEPPLRYTRLPPRTSP